MLSSASRYPVPIKIKLPFSGHFEVMTGSLLAMNQIEDP